MSFFIICPGCKHTLALPQDVIGQQVRCPKCELEFEAHPTATPALDAAAAPRADAPGNNHKPDVKPPPLPSMELDTAYAPSAKSKSRSAAPPIDGPSVYCVECGTQYPRGDDSCPHCGYRNYDLLAENLGRGRRPRARELPPVYGFLAVMAAFFIPLGVAMMIFGPAVSDGFRRPGRAEFVIGVISFCLGGAFELAAFVLGLVWLYQAWRAVLERDEEYSPGLMVGLLAVPFFNFYWMFHAVPGLSAALTRELRHVAPTRSSNAGWTAGLVACILFLIPYLQPIAICIFIAWMLIANNAVHRLARIHARLREEEDAERDGEPRELGAPSRASGRLSREEV